MTSYTRTDRCVDTLKANNPISSIIGQHVELKRCGAELRGCCPFHADRTPSFYVNDHKGQFHCFGCGAGGDLIEFTRKIYEMTFSEAYEYLASDATIIPFSTKWDPADRKDRGHIVRKIWECAIPIADTPAETYLASRSIPATLSRDQRNFRYATLPLDGSEELYPALVVAARDLDGEVVAIQRTFLTEAGEKIGKNCKRSLGSLRGAAVEIVGPKGPSLDNGLIFLTEGIEDAASVALIMGRATVFAALGTSNMANVVLPEGCTEIVIAHDNDEAGRAAATEAMVRFVQQGVQVSLQSPSEFKDWNEHLVYWDQKTKLQHYNELPWVMNPELLCDEFDFFGEDGDA